MIDRGIVNSTTVDSIDRQGLYYYGLGIGTVDTSYGILMVIKAGDYTLQVAWSFYIDQIVLRNKTSAAGQWHSWKKIATTNV